jgi:epoxyqueuosine reductase
MAEKIPYSLIKELCRQQGFAHCVTGPVPDALESKALDLMLADGVGEMEFMQRNRELLLKPGSMLPAAKSMIIAALPYQNQLLEEGQKIRRARYAAGKDYHKLVRRKLAAVAKNLSDEKGDAFPNRAFADSAPLMERKLAQMTGLGWQGKNSLILNQALGSFFFLGVLLTEAEIESWPGEEALNRCGKCHKCHDACPTGALQEGRVISEKCISYLTIEYSGVIPRELAEKFNGWWYGCDICQQVCPWNRKAPGAGDERLMGQDESEDLLKIREADFPYYFAGRAVKRISYPMFRRNLLVAFWSLGERGICLEIIDEGVELVLRQAVELGLK